MILDSIGYKCVIVVANLNVGTFKLFYMIYESQLHEIEPRVL